MPGTWSGSASSPPSPSSTCSRSAGVETIVKTTSRPRSSATLSTTVAPSSSSGSALALVRFHTVTRAPARRAARPSRSPSGRCRSSRPRGSRNRGSTTPSSLVVVIASALSAIVCTNGVRGAARSAPGGVWSTRPVRCGERRWNATLQTYAAWQTGGGTGQSPAPRGPPEARLASGVGAIECEGVLMGTHLVVGAFTPSVLLSVARRTGRLEERGLDVEEVPVASSPGQFRSLLDGEIDVAFTSPDNVLAYRFGPTNPLGALADVSIVSTVDRGCGLGLYGRPGFGGPERPARGGGRRRRAHVRVRAGDVLPRRLAGGGSRRVPAGRPRLHPAPPRGTAGRRVRRDHAQRRQRAARGAGRRGPAGPGGRRLRAVRRDGAVRARRPPAGGLARAGRGPARHRARPLGTARGRRRGGRGRAAAGPAARARRAVRRPAHVRGRGADPVRRARPRRPRDHRRPAPHAPAGPGGDGRRPRLGAGAVVRALAPVR